MGYGAAKGQVISFQIAAILVAVLDFTENSEI